MASLDSAREIGFFASDVWTWWQARRLRYNLMLAACGWVAYFTAIALSYGFGEPLWSGARQALSMTLFLGTGWLVVMGVANVAFLLGPAVEGWIRPADVPRYRRTAWGMGLWGSAAVPFLFPLLLLSSLIAGD
jgi:hypothetical protein